MGKLLSACCFGLAALLLGSCATAPDPESAPRPAGDGRALLEASARSQGIDWRKVREVRVAYEGRWALFPRLTQPVLVDAGYRGTSEERVWPRSGRVEQRHAGPEGTKRVSRRRAGAEVAVSYDGTVTRDPEIEAAASLVADAYPMFLFGASWVLDQGRDFRPAGVGRLGGATCDLVEATLRPGLGAAAEDRVVVWIDRETKRTRRIHFSLNGLESTRGAEVDVTMDGFVTAPDGGQWPTRFVEWIRRPISTRAHTWWTTSLVVDGRRLK